MNLNFVPFLATDFYLRDSSHGVPLGYVQDKLSISSTATEGRAERWWAGPPLAIHELWTDNRIPSSNEGNDFSDLLGGIAITKFWKAQGTCNWGLLLIWDRKRQPRRVRLISERAWNTISPCRMLGLGWAGEDAAGGGGGDGETHPTWPKYSQGLYELITIIIFPLEIRKVNSEKWRAHPTRELLSCDLTLQCLEELRLLWRPSLSGAVESQGDVVEGVVVAGLLKYPETVWMLRGSTV